MKKIVLSVIILLIALSCNTSTKNETLLKKENELLKREIELQKKEQELLIKNEVKKKKTNTHINKSNNTKSNKTKVASLIKQLSSLLGETLVKIDTNGNIKYDSGTASNGRFSGNLKNVTLDLQYHKNSDCDGCPSQGILANIVFKCKNNSACLEDMGFKQTSNLITFGNKETAKKVYDLLIQIQKYL